jgi:hypothetical protein
VYFRKLRKSFRVCSKAVSICSVIFTPCRVWQPVGHFRAEAPETVVTKITILVHQTENAKR